MNTYRICGTVSVDVYAEIDAPTFEDAMEYARDNFEMTEYCNGTIGVEDRSYEFGDGEINCCCDIDWWEDYSECIAEDVETETNIWDEEENENED